MLLLFFLFCASLCLEIPNNWQQQCSFLNLRINGEEGKFNSSEYKLRGIVVLFRHGERSGLLNHSEPDGCAPFNTSDDDAFQKFKELVLSSKFQDFIGITHEKLGNYSLLPHRSHCSRGELTAEGALQHAKLGTFFNTSYGASGFFKNGDRAILNVTVATTNYNRTLQSAIAFMSTFLFPYRSKLNKINFTIANNTLICFDDNCHCPYAQNIWKRAMKEEYNVYLELATPEIKKIVERIAQIPGFSTSNEPYKIIDTLLTKFICRRRKLPCTETGCLKYEDLDKLNKFIADRGTYWYNHSEKYIRHVVDDLKSLNFFSQLLSEIRTLSDKSSFIRIISAHDVTIEALLHNMGILLQDPPRYTARIVFEKEPLNFFIRMLYNGEDYTGKLKFCGNLVDSLCPAEKVKDFYINLQKTTNATKVKCFE